MSPDSTNHPLFAKLTSLKIRGIQARAPNASSSFVGIAAFDWAQYFCSMPMLSDLSLSRLRTSNDLLSTCGAETYRQILRNAPKSLKRLKLYCGFHLLIDNFVTLGEVASLIMNRNLCKLRELRLIDIYPEQGNVIDDMFVSCLPKKLRRFELRSKLGILGFCLSPKGWSSFPHSLQVFRLDCTLLQYAESMMAGLRDSLPSSCRLIIPPTK